MTPIDQAFKRHGIKYTVRLEKGADHHEVIISLRRGDLIKPYVFPTCWPLVTNPQELDGFKYEALQRFLSDKRPRVAKRPPRPTERPEEVPDDPS